MDIVDNGETLSLTFFAGAVPEFLNENVHTYMGKPVELEDELIDMDRSINTTYTAGCNFKKVETT